MGSGRVATPAVGDLRVLPRRRFLILLGVSLSSAALAACGGDGDGEETAAQQLPTPYSFPGTSDKDSVHDSCIPGHPGC